MAAFHWSLWLTRNDSVFHKYGLKYFYKSYSGHIASDFEVNCNEVKIRKNASTMPVRPIDIGSRLFFSPMDGPLCLRWPTVSKIMN